jgi:hypothetical protein
MQQACDVACVCIIRWTTFERLTAPVNSKGWGTSGRGLLLRTTPWASRKLGKAGAIVGTQMEYLLNVLQYSPLLG